MNCQRARESFPELLDSRTPATALLEARQHLAGCPDCQREFAALSQTLTALDTLPTPQPSSRLRKNFYAMLEEEKHSAASMHAATERRQRASRATLWRWVLSPLAGCALVALGFYAGQRSAPTPSQAVASVSPETVAMRNELNELRAEMKKVNNLVGVSLLQQQQRPASERLQAVFTSATQQDPTEKAINDLITSLAFDPSTNVRLRALEGLAPHAESDVVRAGVLHSLAREENPLVQVAMIDFLAAAKEREARPVLEKISGNDNADLNVRAAARRALTEL